MYKILRALFAVLGMVFFGLLLALAYVVVADPFNLSPVVDVLWQSGTTAPKDTVSGTDVAPPAASPSVKADATDPNGASASTPAAAGLSAEQTAALKTVGVDPNTLPTTISPDQEACFIGILGASRVAEIKSGATPTATEFFAARGCIK